MKKKPKPKVGQGISIDSNRYINTIEGYENLVTEYRKRSLDEYE